MSEDELQVEVEVIRRAIDGRDVTVVVQPVVRLEDGATVGFEALARLGAHGEGPADLLDRAHDLGVRVELELACLRAAVDRGLPPQDRLLFVNVSPRTLLDERVEPLCAALAGRLVVEITERDPVDDYAALRAWRDRWRHEGVALAVDDTGAGHASLAHVLELEPDYVKLDRTLISGIDSSRSRTSLVRALQRFADDMGSWLVAEGVERAEEAHCLRRLGVGLAQGFALGRPGAGWVAGATPVTAPA